MRDGDDEKKRHPWYIVAFFMAGMIWFSINSLAGGIGLVQQQLISLSNANQQAQQAQQQVQALQRQIEGERMERTRAAAPASVVPSAPVLPSGIGKK